MRRILAIAVLAAGVLASTMSAAPIGTLDISGVGNIFVSATMIDFGPTGSGWGNFIVTGATLGFDTGVDPLDPGNIRDLDIATAPPGPPLATPIDPFILVPAAFGPPFPGAGPAVFSFNLERILLGGGPSCVPSPGVGTSCTPTELVANSPFLLSQNPGAVTGSMVVTGTGTDLSDGSTAPYRALFTFNLVGVSTVPAALAIVAAGGAVESSWSAQIFAIPEPGTFSLVAGFMLLAAGVYKRRANRK